MEETQIIMEKLETQAKRQDDMRIQLDKDRNDIDQIRIDLSKNTDITEKVLNQMVDFKQEIRQQIQDVISSELPKIVKKEIRLLSVKNPRKQIKGRFTLLEWIKNLLKNE